MIENLQLGRNPDVLPMVIEGPAGVVLSAVGTKSDHRIAGDCLQKFQEERVRRGIPMPTGTALARGSLGQQRSFGVVYEHRDSSGKPVFVGHSAKHAEERFRLDSKKHQGVKNLLTYQGGKSEVVWAAVGTFPVGHAQMQEISEHVCSDRASMNQAQKLNGPKPYSSHGF